MRGKHRKTSRTRKALKLIAASIAAGAVLTLAGLLSGAPAQASTRPTHAQCWPLADRGRPGTGSMCVPDGRGLRYWSWTPENSQAWENRMHYLECRHVGAYRQARGLVFGCEGTPAPQPFPPGLWAVIGHSI